MSDQILDETLLTHGSTSPFLPDTFIQFAWDSTCLGLIKTCPRLYQYTMIDGYVAKGESIHLRFGQEYHQALQDYDIARAEGIPHEDAIHSAISELVRRTHDWSVDETVKPGKYKNRQTLVSLVVDYLDHYVDDPAETYIKSDGKPAVELSFRFELDWGPSHGQTHGSRELDEDAAKLIAMGADPGPTFGQPYLLCGHMDRVVTFNDQLFVMDHKDQPLTTCVLTPDGWKPIGLLKLDELIAGKDGKFYPVIGIYPQGMQKVYRITFNDRTSVECGHGHLWTIKSNINDLPRTLSTSDMLHARYYEEFCVPLCAAIQHPEKNLPLDPYVLGALLGDGYLGGNSPQLSSQSREIPMKVAERLNGDIIKENMHPDSLAWTISGGRTLKALRELNLYGCLSRTKFIPEIYLYSSIQQRWDLLNGLMDTDGSRNGLPSNGWRYKSMSRELIEDVCELVRSLGGTARWSIGANECYQATLRLKEWGHVMKRRYISSIEEVEMQETCCISINSPDHLYITENHIVTHNTTTTTPSQYYFNQYEPHNQMTLYTIAGQVVLNAPIKGVIVRAAQILLTHPTLYRIMHHTIMLRFLKPLPHILSYLIITFHI